MTPLLSASSMIGRPAVLRRLSGIALMLVVASSAQAALLSNGGFEAGDFSGWTVTAFTGQHLGQDDSKHTTANFLANEAAGLSAIHANGVVTSQNVAFDGNGPVASNAVIATEASHLAFISNETGAGDGSIVGSAIRTTFTAIAHASTLTFNTQFLSNEEVDGAFDFGGIALLDSFNHILAELTLDSDPTNGSSAAHAHATLTTSDPSSPAHPGVGGFLNSTGWLTGSFDLAGLDGQQLTLLAFSTQTGDDQTESRLLLDNVAQTASNPVPLPTSVAFLLPALVGLFTGVRRRRSWVH